MAEEMSKSAKRRQAKKARDKAHEEAAAPPPPAPEPKAKAKAKAAAAEPKAKAAAEPKGKAKAKPEPPAPAAKPKAKAAAAAVAEPKAAPAPKAEPKAQSKQKAAAKAKASAAKAPPAEELVKREELIQPFAVDDGTGDAWEQATGLSKKMEKQKMKAEQAKQAEAAAKQAKIPGMAAQNSIPGMGPAAVQRATQAEINAVLRKAQAAGVAARQSEEAKQAEAAGATAGLHTGTVKVPDNRIGVVIGPKGKNIQMIQEKTGVTRIDTTGEVFTIMGEAKAVEQAEAAIKELIEKGYWSQQFEDFKEEGVAVHPSVLPDLIGKGGVIIKAMKTEFGVEVNIPEVPKNAPAGKKFKVTLAGKKENVEACKEAINNIAMYGYDEHTHPGQTHEELDIPDWSYRFLIGKAGSEMRHIQNNYKVKVNIPREHSACQAVVCVGEKINVERAKAYIDKLLWAAENQTKGREKSDGAEDHWGKEEDEEDWMKAYMYKRN